MDGAWYDISAPKEETNLTLNQDLVAKVRALGGSLSERVERLLEGELQAEARRQASIDAAIDAHNEFTRKHGFLFDEFNNGRFY
ncbi:MAG TPA: type II toxin-antitoxin system CcdA family antitoxin [Azospirillaceae bacterium]|nr:type II toxin-antitoxin system CcdA family antitoxin [Azospirillaceae bacterium]